MSVISLHHNLSLLGTLLLELTASILCVARKARLYEGPFGLCNEETKQEQ